MSHPIGPPEFSEIYRVRHPEVSAAGYLKPQYLFDYLQETAATHAIMLGCGMPFLHANHLAWVVSQLKLEYFGHPTHGDDIRVRTWCSGLDKFFATREFEWFRGDERLGRASSRWLIITTDTFRPRKPENVLSIPMPAPVAPPFFTDFDKIPRCETSDALDYTIRDSQIDLNRHLNNAEYAAFMQDWLCEKTGATPMFRTMRIHFLADLKRGEHVAVAGSLGDDGAFYIEGTKPDGICCFQCIGTIEI